MMVQIASAPTATDRVVAALRRERERGRKPQDAPSDAFVANRLLSSEPIGDDDV